MRLVYKDCRFCKGTGELLGRKCKVCKGEGQIAVKVFDRNALNEVEKESESDKRNEAFNKFMKKLNKNHGEVSGEVLVMLREAFDSGICYKEQKKK